LRAVAVAAIAGLLLPLGLRPTIVVVVVRAVEAETGWGVIVLVVMKGRWIGADVPYVLAFGRR
jgi:hypothetical protein